MATVLVHAEGGDRTDPLTTMENVNGESPVEMILGSSDYDNGEAYASAVAYLGSGSVAGLRVAKAGEGRIVLEWGASCLATDTDYAIYEGRLRRFTSHDSLHCSTLGRTTTTVEPPWGDRYYLVVPINATREGSYGTSSDGAERPASRYACLPQKIGGCPPVVRMHPDPSCRR